jgi:hypothetical protein
MGGSGRGYKMTFFFLFLQARAMLSRRLTALGFIDSCLIVGSFGEGKAKRVLQSSKNLQDTLALLASVGMRRWRVR